ncbi:MAG: hypothetical protein ACON5H_03955 [Akkermansiaceae bacterium]
MASSLGEEAVKERAEEIAKEAVKETPVQSVEKSSEASAIEEESAKDTTRVVFMDETTITGAVHSIDGENGTLEFTSPSLKGRSVLKTGKLLDLQLDFSHDAPESEHYALATIKPRYNEEPPQDSIRGTFVGIDAEHITLDTWYAGKLKLKRSLVQGLDIFENSPRLFNGPTSLEGWVSSSGDMEKNWEFKQRALVSKGSGSIARKIAMPDKLKLSFHVAWKGSPYFKASFLSNSNRDSYSNRGYALQVQTSYISFSRTGPKRDRTDLYSQNQRTLLSQEGANFEIYLDRAAEGANALYVDGKKLTNWEGVDDLEGMGEWLMFAPNRNRAVKVSRIAVSQWDGQLPLEKTEGKVEAEDVLEGLSGQRINLANGDAVLGEVSKVEDGNAVLKTVLGELNVPVARLRSFGLESEEDQPRMYGKDIRAWFTEGGSVTLRLDAITPEKLRGYSQVFGEAEFDLRAFSRIEFNIWTPERETFERSEDW